MGLLQPRSALDADPEFRLAPTQLAWPADVPRHKHYHDEPRDPWGKWTDDPQYIDATPGAAPSAPGGAGTDQLKTGTGGGMGGAKGAAPGIPTPRNFRTLSDSEWTALANAKHKWTPAQLQTVIDYTGSLYSPMNQSLRGNEEGEDSAYIKQAIKNMDGAMETLKEDTMVYRGMSTSGFPPGWTEEDPADLIGKTMQDMGYMSTSVDRGSAFGGNVKLEIEVPKGHKQVVPGVNSMFPSEREMVLARGTKMLITDAYVDGGVWHLKVRAGK